MTKGPILVLVFLSTIPTLADEKPWPQKGDTIFVSARLLGMTSAAVAGFQLPDMPTIEACEPLIFRKQSTDGRTTIIKDHIGYDRKLRGAWRTYIHKTVRECSAHEKPEFVKFSRGYLYELPPE